MIRPRLLGSVAVVALAGTVANARAEDSYDAPIAGITLSEGPRWGPASPSGATLGGVGVFAGGRWTGWRLGALGRANWWDGSRGPLVDAGLFVSGDLTGVFIDPRLSLAPFLRVEPGTFRWESHADVWAWAPSAVLGARAVGVEIGAAVTYERWFSDLGGGSGKDGIIAELRLGFELGELSRLFGALQQGSTPQPP